MLHFCRWRQRKVDLVRVQGKYTRAARRQQQGQKRAMQDDDGNECPAAK
jgi:hypothetical protein